MSTAEKELKEIRALVKEVSQMQNHKVYGAVAFLRSEENSDNFAESQSLFVIRATGNSASIENKQGFIPKAF